MAGSGSTYGRPRNSATGWFVTWPATVLQLRASAGSPCRLGRTVDRHLELVGSVALVRAYVDVCGTAPGMLPTA